LRYVRSTRALLFCPLWLVCSSIRSNSHTLKDPSGSFFVFLQNFPVDIFVNFCYSFCIILKGEKRWILQTK
jgi:hypothetical protein